jgi:FAD/FMN-containing dehydrogenase
MSTLLDTAGLRDAIRGSVLTPGEAEYDSARRIWNGMIDRRPSLIVRCAGAADVIRAVNVARESGLLVAVRGGGHSFPGYSVCDDGMMIDLQPMKSVRVDTTSRTVRAEPGVTWGEFDRETQAFGLATTGGMISHTGIAGLTLGGGFGWLMRKHGLSVDNLISVDLVTAAGDLVRASETENADLFWGLRGGGGNFGIVTSFEYRLHELATPVLAGLIAYPLTEAKQVLRRLEETMTAAPDELVVAAVLMTTPDGHPAVGIAPCYAGDPGAGETVIAPLRKLGTPVMQQIGPMPYTAVQTIFNDAAVPGRRFYMRSNYLETLSDEVIGVLADAYPRTPSPLSAVLIVTMGGAVRRAAVESTAYYHRRMAYTMTVLGSWIEAQADEANIRWIKELFAGLDPHLPEGVYVNELHDEGADRVRAAYGASYARLAALKRQYDPTNFFRLNQNIRTDS